MGPQHRRPRTSPARIHSLGGRGPALPGMPPIAPPRGASHVSRRAGARACLGEGGFGWQWTSGAGNPWPLQPR
eukprot:6314583-Lingulodinium_polyedra.AAC.1